jgi:hypothetical protein
MRKIILISVITISMLDLILFLIVKFNGFVDLKNSCMRNISNPNGYELALYFDTKTPQADIDKFGDEIKILNGVKNVEVITKDQALREFIKNNQGDDKILKSIAASVENPLLSSVVVTSSMSDIDAFLEFERDVLDDVDNSGLKLASYRDGDLEVFQKEFAKVKNVSLIKDFPNYILSGERSHYFEKYSVMCNQKFSKP